LPARSSKRRKTVKAILDQYGRTWAEEAGILVENKPAPLFQLLCLSLLLSARIRNETAVSAQRALIVRGWTTPKRLLASTWEERAHVLNRSGYARYDEKTSRMLEQVSRLLESRWRGDLRKLRDEAHFDCGTEHRLLQVFSGIGPVGATIFSRECQGLWDELYPYADTRSLDAARRLGIARSVEELAHLCPRPDFPRLVAGLVRIDLARAYDKVDL